MGFTDRSTGRGTFGANLGRAIVTMGTLRRTCATEPPRRAPLPKLLWVDLFVFDIAHNVCKCEFVSLSKSEGNRLSNALFKSVHWGEVSPQVAEI